MPRVYAPRRPHVGYREDADVLAAVDRLAWVHGVDRSDVLRFATRAYVGVGVQSLSDAVQALVQRASALTVDDVARLRRIVPASRLQRAVLAAAHCRAMPLERDSEASVRALWDALKSFFESGVLEHEQQLATWAAAREALLALNTRDQLLGTTQGRADYRCLVAGWWSLVGCVHPDDV